MIILHVHDMEAKCFDIIFEANHASLVFQVHALETAAIKPDPANQFISAGIVSGVATVSIGQYHHLLLPSHYHLLQAQCWGFQPSYYHS